MEPSCRVEHVLWQIVVVNEALMDNHQAELAQEMEVQGHSFAATVSTLIDVLTSAVKMARKSNMHLDCLVARSP